MEDITNADYTHAKRVCKDFKIKKPHGCLKKFLLLWGGCWPSVK